MSVDKFLRLMNNEFDRMREDYEAGDSNSLMKSIWLCAKYELPLPSWVAGAYIQAYDQINSASENSWDAVFGKPYPKGYQTKLLGKRRIDKFNVWLETTIMLRAKPDTPIDDMLFESVGDKFGIGKTLASEYYYAMKKWFNQF